MITQGVGYSNYPTTGTPASGASQGEMTRQEFLNLLTAQLTHQDPMNPMENSELMNQMVMLENLQSQEALTNSIKGLLHESKVGSAASLMGKTVRGVDAGGKVASGIVTGVAITGNSIDLVLNGNAATTIELGNVTDVTFTY
jgi:flagellar basal-body rod modification protein FlgD